MSLTDVKQKKVSPTAVQLFHNSRAVMVLYMCSEVILLFFISK
jgi:hypothetical protein